MLRCVGAKSKRMPFAFCSMDCWVWVLVIGVAGNPILHSHKDNCNQIVSESCFRSFTVDNGPIRDLNFGSSSVHSILLSSGLQHWFKNRNELRMHKLTASAFAGAIGFWPCRRTQLWLEKIGAIEPFSSNLATCWSNIKEEEALERYKLITGNSVLFPEFKVYGVKDLEDNWLAGSPAGVVDKFVFGLPSRGVLEMKCPFFNGDMKKGFPLVTDSSLLYSTGSRFDGDNLNSSLFRLYRDLEYWEALKIALSDFLWNHVQPAREICSKYCVTNPLTELRSLRPSPRHDLCSYIVYENKRIVDSSKLLVREIDGTLQN